MKKYEVLCEICGSLTHTPSECPYDTPEDDEDMDTPDLYDDEDYENDRDNAMSWGDE